MISLRIIQLIINVIVVGLSVSSGVLLLVILQGRIVHDVVPLINVISGFLLTILIIVNSIIIGYIQLLFQVIVSLMYVVSGVLQVLHNVTLGHTVIFIVNVMVIACSICFTWFNMIKAVNVPNEEESIESTLNEMPVNYKLSTPNNPIRTSISTPNFISNIQNQTTKRNKFKQSNSVSTLLSVSTHNISRDPSSLLVLEDEEEGLRRSKSGIVNKKLKGWKSIHDEKKFLSNVNESFLPPVLKGNKSGLTQDLGDFEFIPDPQDLKMRNKKRKSIYENVLTGLEPISDVIRPVSTTTISSSQPKYYIPAKEPRVDDIDNITDLSTSRNTSETTTIEKTAVPSRTPTPPKSPNHTSPLRKLFIQESPKRILKHNHTISSVSRLNVSPRKFERHRHSASVPTFKILVEPIDLWDINTSYGSEESRNSSVPSGVLGQYDREKWNALQLRGQV